MIPRSSSGVALVTGAGRGIGHRVVEGMRAQGMGVIATARSEHHMDRLSSLGAVPVLCDVTVDEDVQHLGQVVADEAIGGLDAIVTSAGISAPAPIEIQPATNALREIDVNYLGAMRVVQVGLPALRQSQGRIVLIGSVNGHIATPGFATYSASKFALEGFAEALALELSGSGVTVSLVEPGRFDTDMPDGELRRIDEMLESEPSPEVRRVLEMARRDIETYEADDVAALVAAVMKVLQARRPRFRYVVPPWPYGLFTFAHRHLPFGIWKRLFEAVS